MPLTVMLQPIWTKMVELGIREDTAEIRKLFLRYINIVAVYSIFIFIFFMAVLQPLLDLVLKHPMQPGLLLKLGFAGWCVLDLLGGGGVSAVTLALGLTRELSKIAILQTGVFLALSLALIPRHADLGAVFSISTAGSVALPLVFLLIKRHLFVLNHARPGLQDG
jgi:O-antigen/teichoic acid export membrane protein